MGIRFEKDSILNWINEMGKFLRLWVDQWESFDEDKDLTLLKNGYQEYFNIDRAILLNFTEEELKNHTSKNLQIEQIRPLALLFMYDGLLNSDTEEQQNLLQKAKFLLEDVAQQTGNFSFEDFGHLKTIGDHLK